MFIVSTRWTRSAQLAQNPDQEIEENLEDRTEQCVEECSKKNRKLRRRKQEDTARTSKHGGCNWISKNYNFKARLLVVAYYIISLYT